MSERQKWTPREEDLLIALDVVGASTDEISTRLGRSQSSVRGHQMTIAYQKAKDVAMYGHTAGSKFVVGRVYEIAERSNSVHMDFLPATFEYIGKNHDKIPKHLFRSINANRLLTFTDVQIYDYIFNLKEEDGNEKGDARKCRRDTKNAGTQ
jgi:hypothetical protein